jgi:Family of unknown function (DUF6454)
MEELVATLDATSTWELEREDYLQFDAYHVQGMARANGTYWISSVDEEHRRGLIFVVAADFALVQELRVGNRRSYHPGGMDIADGFLWVPVAPYEASGPTLVQRVSLTTGEAETAFVVEDHLGASACLPNGEVVAWNWGARELTKWTRTGELIKRRRNPSHFLEWQDIQVVGAHHVVCGGRACLPTTESDAKLRLGGLVLLETSGLEIENEVHFPGYSPSGLPGTAEAFVLWADGDHLRLTAFPDGGHGPIMTWCCRRDGNY